MHDLSGPPYSKALNIGGLRRAIGLLAYDNGCINRGRPREEDLVESVLHKLRYDYAHTTGELIECNRQLNMLSEGNFEELLVGEQGLTEFPEGPSTVLLHAFEAL